MRRRRPRDAGRRACGLVLALAVAVGAMIREPAVAQEPQSPVLVVSRERVLQEAVPADRLNEAEAAMTAELQSRVDAIKAELSAEEQELTRLRGTLPADEFERRVQSFDQRVRTERENTQRRAAALQTAFREARQKLAEALVPILVTLSREKGAKLVLDRDQILVAHPSIDVTDEVIAMMNERISVPELPTLKDLTRGADADARAGEPAAGPPD